MEEEFVAVKVNGKDIPIKDFVQDIIGGAVAGMVRTLRMVPDDINKIELVVDFGKKVSE
ncbi:MAG: hypothetical protein ACTSU5_13785 [Promethearchaeota archaeon]